MGVAWLAALALGGSTIVFERDAHIASEVVTLDDVADLSALPAALFERARGVKVATFSGTGDRLTLSVPLICERARAQLPALAAWLPQAEQSAVIVDRAPTPPRSHPSQTPARSCVRVAAAVEAGATPIASDFEAAPCNETALDHPFRYDAGAQVLRTTTRLGAGALVEAPPPNLLAGVKIGDPLSLAVRIGPVVVERDATVARPAHAEERVFVRTRDGRVFAVPYPERAP